MGRRDEIIERVRAVAEPLALQEGLELVDVQLGGAGRTELILYIDRLPHDPDRPAAPHPNMPPQSDAAPDTEPHAAGTHADVHSEAHADEATSAFRPLNLTVEHIDDAETIEAKPIEFKVHPLDAVDDDPETPETAIESVPAQLERPAGVLGVSLDDCANFSRIVSTALDVEDPLDGSYELVVSSPGLDRPLRTRAHFEKYAGSRVRVKIYGPLPAYGDRKTFIGKLLGYDAERGLVVIDIDGRRFEVPHKLISKANLEPVFDL